MFLVTIYLWSVNIWLITCKKVATLTHSEFVIDPLESPTLHRAQRIIHARPTEIRQAEALKTLDALEAAHDAKMEKLENAHAKEMYNKTEKHRIAADAWQYDFEEDERAKKALRAKEDAKKAEEARAIEQAKLAEHERNRQALYAKNRAEELVNSSEIDKWRAIEKKYHWTGVMVYVDPNASANIRNLPSAQVPNLRIAEPNEAIAVNGWLTSESLYGNNIWYRVRDGGWVWSGVVGASTIPYVQEKTQNLNEDPQFETIRSWDGTAIRTVQTNKPSYIRKEVETAISQLEHAMEENRKKFASLGAIKTPETLTQDLVDLMTNCAEHHDRLKKDLDKKKAELTAIESIEQGVRDASNKISDGRITAGYINAGSITANQIRIDSFGISGPGFKLEAPKETMYSFPHERPKDPTDLLITQAQDEVKGLKKQVQDLIDQKDDLSRQMQQNQAIATMNNTVNQAIGQMYMNS